MEKVDQELRFFSEAGWKLKELLWLESYPVAFRFIENEGEVPEKVFRPKRDGGYHLAQCQAFALSRRNRRTVVMLKEDHWCWAPLVAYGLVPKPDEFISGDIFYPRLIQHKEKAAEIAQEHPVLPEGKYIGIISAPLTDVTFVPQGVLVYCSPVQLRILLTAYSYIEGRMMTTSLFPLNSCVFSIVPIIKERSCRITIPDPGEYQRAAVSENEVIFSMPAERLEDIIKALEHLERLEQGYKHQTREMRPDFARPEFYDKLFRLWKLEVKDVTWCGGAEFKRRE
ncbi:MAG: DUF169 domain-containing protein [Candidatus Bathyarchaeia archaeon]